MHERVLWQHTVGFAAALGLTLCACKQPMAAPPAAPPAPASQAADPTPAAVPEDEPPRDPFALDEASDDPKTALESMKHNCCDEMPANEIREHVGDAPPQPNPKTK